jgi:hypothetical protein
MDIDKLLERTAKFAQAAKDLIGMVAVIIPLLRK